MRQSAKSYGYSSKPDSPYPYGIYNLIQNFWGSGPFILLTIIENPKELMFL